jgi:putative FmdB family regulatory protein
MPFYEYRCDSCGHEFEAMQKMSDEPLTDCPSCSQAELVKLISAAGFRLKGGGWYETDFKGGSKKNVAESSGTSDGGHSCGTGSCPACS